MTLASALAALLASAGPAQQTLPSAELFRPLVADPKQPQFFAAWLWVDSPRLAAQVSSVGLGETIGLVRGAGERWQISVAAGVFSQFNMETPSYDLLNTDFLIGIPFTWRRAAWSARVRVYHQSSHLGDEFILNTSPERVNLSFEAIELLVSRDLGAWRPYAGGEYVVRHEPADLDPGVLHWGVEVRPAAVWVRLGHLGAGRFVSAIDAKASEQRKWQVGWSGRAGLEFAGTSAAARRWSVQLHAYDGPTPYGQFYQENVRSAGLGLHFSL